jgi:hypothetical protein
MKKLFATLFISKTEKRKEKEAERIAIRRLLGIVEIPSQLK